MQRKVTTLEEVNSTVSVSFGIRQLTVVGRFVGLDTCSILAEAVRGVVYCSHFRTDRTCFSPSKEKSQKKE